MRRMESLADHEAPVEILERTEDFSIAGWGRVLLLVFRTRSTAQGIERLHALAPSWAAARSGGVVLLNVVPPQPARPPDEAMRAALRRAVEDGSPGVLGVGTIFEGSGFVAAFVRALMSGLQRHSGRLPMRVFRGAPEAAGWAAHVLDGGQISAAGLSEAIRAVRQA